MQDIEISEDIVIKASKGNSEAFECIYRAYSGFVYNSALRIVSNTESAREITQEVFIAVYKKLKHFEFRASFKTWLYRIAINTTLNYCGRLSKEQKNAFDYNDAIKINDVYESPEETVEKQRNKDILKSLFEVLSPDQRACIMLRNLDGLSYKEIADTLDVNINTVRTRLKRAREALINLCNSNKQEVLAI